MEETIEITRELANDIIFAFQRNDKHYSYRLDQFFRLWGIDSPENDSALKKSIAELSNGKMETLLLKID